jgi:UDP-2,3-diacylglucosamine pyrophosphatase LpxH
MKSLYVGDVHATVGELEDCQRLTNYIKTVAASNKVDNIVFLGDQYHNHDIVRLGVVQFWSNAVHELSKVADRLIFLVGNHDKPNDANATMDAMQIHTDQQNVLVVSFPIAISGIVYAPYAHDRSEFVDTVNALAKSGMSKTLVCHQTFDGSKYENGFYCEDGVDHNSLQVDHIISGHIHSPQSFGKVQYLGAPRWRSISDANIERTIMVVEHAEDGSIISQQHFSTSGVCRPIYEYEDTQNGATVTVDQVKSDIDRGAKVFVSLAGTPEYVHAQKGLYKAAGAIVRCRFIGTTTAKVKESDGIDVAFTKYAGSVATKHGSDPAAVVKNIQSRMGRTQ